MTETEWETIERVARIYNFTIHAATEYNGRRVTNTPDASRSSFWWGEEEGFDEFFGQVATYFREVGYDSASRW